MTTTKYLTTEEVSERYRGAIAVSTLENWLAYRIGPPFLKVGKAVLYSEAALDEWDESNTVSCKRSKVIGRKREAAE